MSIFYNAAEANLAHFAIIQFSVAAVSAIGESQYSPYNTEGAAVYALANKLSAAVTSNSGTDVVVTWDAPTSGAPVTGY
jgi:hypothetical protein